MRRPGGAASEAAGGGGGAPDAPRGGLPTPHRRTVVAGIGIVVAAVVVLAGGAALLQAVRGPDGPPDREVVQAVAADFLAAWSAGDLAALDRQSDSPTVAPAYTRLAEDLVLSAVRTQPGRGRVDGDSATVEFTAELELRGLGTWSYDGALPLRRREDAPAGEPAWAVAWSPAAVHPSLGPGERLARTRQRPARAPVLAVDGTVLDGPGAPVLPALGAAVLGRVGPATAEQADAAGGRLLEGDPIGSSGLQAAFDDQLAGDATGSVVRVDAAGTPLGELHRFPGAPGEALVSTIDPAVQAAAEAALGGGGPPAALVALDVGTGGIRAVVSRPLGGFNRALDGRYPPGSTFKVVTTTALLESGVRPDDVVPCPARTSVDGRSFGNFAGEALGDVVFRVAFARSCNTAFVELASRLDPTVLAGAARRFGFDADVPLPLGAAGGSYPEPRSTVELAASGIGQGRVTASPLHMASVAAAVAGGGWRPPVLVAGPPVAPVAALEPASAATLAELMRAVVAEGTGAAARVPGEPVAGKTGTAEFGTAVPPETHAWFIGFRDGLAVAVLVEGGTAGGTVAAPIAGDFFSRR